MSHRKNVVTGLALAVLVGCTPAEDSDSSRKPTDHTIEAKVGLENGEIDIDYDYHDEVLVRPGDRVEWVCDCAPGIEFSVTEPTVLLDIDGLTGIERGDGWNRQALVALAEGLPDTSTAAKKFLNALAPALPATLGANQSPPTLFKQPVPRRTGDRDSPIQSPAVRDNPGSRLWKFTWKFRLKDSPAEPEEWDPHIFSTVSR